MTIAGPPKKAVLNVESISSQWLKRLGDLVDHIEGWAKELDWSTRRIEVNIEDSQIGTYRAPALLMQKETTRAFLDPISHSTPGSEGLVDLYLMPAYDDIARLYFQTSKWHLTFTFPDSPAQPATRKTRAKTLSRKTFQEVLEEMVKHDSRAISMD
jgi:hypothetical protein